MLASVLQAAPDRAPAVIVPNGPTITYGGLRREVERAAAALAGAGAGPGSRVSIVLGNGPEFIISFLGAARAGAVAAPLNPAYTADEFEFYIGDAAAALAVAPPGPHPAKEACSSLGVPVAEASIEGGGIRLTSGGRDLPQAADPPAPAGDSTALFLHTSGTTSRPKGVPLSHRNLLASVRNTAGTYGLAEGDTAMLAMPLFHVHGLIGVALSTLATGGALIAPPRFSAGGFWPAAQAAGATWYSAVPTIHRILLGRADADGAPAEGLRFIRSCSAPISPEVIGALERRFGAPVVEAYGMTEASHQMSSNPLPPGERRPGSVGAGTGVEVSVRDEAGTEVETGRRGEVCVRGPNVMEAYADNPEATADAFWGGWFRTGDQGALSGDGYLTLTGRLKELINRGGEKISPVEVDEALLSHPAVAEAVAFGAPDSKYGESVRAAVVLRADATVGELRDHCAARLAAFKVPDVVHVVGEIPRTATGKIQRRHVAAGLADPPAAG